MSPNANTSDSYETEWQFDATDLDRVADWLTSQPASAALTFALKKDALQTDVYLDTEDWAVHRAGYGLRVRRSGESAEATLKAFGAASSGGPRVRREINQALPPDDIDLLAAQGPVSDRVRLLAGKQTLRPLFEVANRRRAFRAESRGVSVAEVALDEVSISSSGETRGLKRVEIEASAPGWETLLPSFVAALAADLELQPAATSKFEAGLQAAGLDPGRWQELGSTVASPDADACQFALAIARRFFGTMVQHEPGTRLGEDPEELHQMRVSLRRLRAAASMFRDVLPPNLEQMQDDLRWLGRCLGEVRDRDVQIESFAEMRSTAPWEESNALGELLQVLEGLHAEARDRLVQALDSERYATLLASLKEALAERESPEPQVAVRDFVAPILRRRYRNLRNQAEALTPESEPVAYHQVRIRGKRLRYSVEFVRPLYERPAERMAEAMVEAQDLLGEHQDGAVAIDWLRNLVRERGHSLAPQTLLFMGELMARRRLEMAELREAWPDVFREVRKRWRRLDKALDEATEADTTDAEEASTAAALLPTIPGPRLRRWQRGPFALLRRRRRGAD